MRIKLTRGERFKDARIEHNQHGKQKMAEVESATGIRSSMLSDLENDDKNRDVSYDKVATLAKHYGVSADYLLGLDPYPRTNATLRSISEYTGLSEEAISFLHYLNTEESCIDQKRTISFLNRILSGDPKALVPCETILTYMEMYVQSERIVRESEKVLPIKTTKKETFNLNVPKLFRAYLLEDINNQLHTLFRQEENNG